MAHYELRLAELRPFFAEIPYYIWGEINYDSEGDCATPTDRNWTGLELTHRDTGEELQIFGKGDSWAIEGTDPTVARAAYFLIKRCQATPLKQDPQEQLGIWDHQCALARSSRVQAVFERPELQPFAVGHWFWGSWKWIGWYGTTFTWVGRWIMESLLTNDKRAVNLCADWLKQGTAGEPQSVALRYALNRLTGLSFDSNEAWVRWYFGGGWFLHGKGQRLYPEPDFKQWHAEWKANSISEEDASA
jgi:hypothetical protein